MDRLGIHRETREPEFHKWIEADLLPRIRAGADVAGVDPQYVTILAILAQLSHPRMGPPPENVCAHAWQLALEAEAIAADHTKHNMEDGKDRKHMTAPLPWLAWLLVATGSLVWRHPSCPSFAGLWGCEPWPGAVVELGFMAAKSVFWTLKRHFRSVAGFPEWLEGELCGAPEDPFLRQIASSCATQIVIGFTQRIGASASAERAVSGKKELYRYLGTWDFRQGTLPFWIACMARGYATALPHGSETNRPQLKPENEDETVPLGLPNIFTRGWAFPELAKLMPIFNARTALQPCTCRHETADPTAARRVGSSQRTHLFWQECCDLCGEPLAGVIEQARFVMPPVCGTGFFFRCTSCDHYTFHMAYVAEAAPDGVGVVTTDEDGTSVHDVAVETNSLPADASIAIWAIRMDDACGISLSDLGKAAREWAASSIPPPAINRAAQWLISQLHKPKTWNVAALLEPSLKELCAPNYADLDDSEMGELLLGLLCETLAGSPRKPAPAVPRKEKTPSVKRPAGFICSLCESGDHISQRSTFLWLRHRPPDGPFVSRAEQSHATHTATPATMSASLSTQERAEIAHMLASLDFSHFCTDQTSNDEWVVRATHCASATPSCFDAGICIVPRNPFRAPVQGIEVIIQAADSPGVVRTVTTNALGQAWFRGLAPGSYLARLPVPLAAPSPVPAYVDAWQHLRESIVSAGKTARATADWTREEIALIGAGLMALMGMRPVSSAVRDRSVAATDPPIESDDLFEACRSVLHGRLDSRREVRVEFRGVGCEMQLIRRPDGRATLRARREGAREWLPFVLIVRRASGESLRISSEGTELSLARLSDFPADFTSLDIDFA